MGLLPSIGICMVLLTVFQLSNAQLTCEYMSHKFGCGQDILLAGERLNSRLQLSRALGNISDREFNNILTSILERSSNSDPQPPTKNSVSSTHLSQNYSPRRIRHLINRSDLGFEVDWALATKNTKYAMSSITYEDKEAAVDYLQKALNLLTTGHE